MSEWENDSFNRHLAYPHPPLPRSSKHDINLTFLSYEIRRTDVLAIIQRRKKKYLKNFALGVPGGSMVTWDLPARLSRLQGPTQPGREAVSRCLPARGDLLSQARLRALRSAHHVGEAGFPPGPVRPVAYPDSAEEKGLVEVRG